MLLNRNANVKFVATFGLVVIVCYFQCSLADKASQIKVLNYITDYANTSYVNVDPGKLRVIKVNETYNRVYIKAEIIKDFPLNTIFAVNVYRSKNNNGPWEFVGSYRTFICDKNDKYRKYLPYNLLSMSRTDGKKCVQKGDYEYKDAGIFKYYELISEGKGYYYKSLNILESGDTTISITRILSQWGDM